MDVNLEEKRKKLKEKLSELCTRRFGGLSPEEKVRLVHLCNRFSVQLRFIKGKEMEEREIDRMIEEIDGEIERLNE